LDQWELALLVGAAVVAAVSRFDHRALLWVALGTVEFALTTIYARHSVPWLPSAFVSGIADAGVAFALITFAQRRWEGALGYVFEFMMMVSFIRLMGLLPDHYVYAVALEALNWVALLLVGGAALLRRVDGYLARSGRRNRVARGVRSLGAVAFGPAEGAPFWAPARR